MNQKFKVTDILIGIIFTLFIISLSVIIIVNFKGLYYYDIDRLGIEAYSGIPKEEIIKNYDALIDYNSPFFTGPLEFPTLPSSEDGLFHFIEVKAIFMKFFLMAPVTLIMILGIILYKRKKRDYRYLLVSSATCILLPTIVGLACAINFDQAFVVFHKLFFNNDKWIFDERYDPIISLLPQEFFLHCAIFIVAFVILGSLMLLVIGLILRKHYTRRNHTHDFTRTYF